MKENYLINNEKIKKIKFEFAMGIVCFFLSFGITWQYRSIRKFTRASEQESTRINKLQEDFKKEIDKNYALQEEIKVTKEEIKKYRENSSTNEFSNVLTEEFKKIEADAGLCDLIGPGVIVRISEKNVKLDPSVDKTWYIVHDTILLDTLNELRASGAEALSLNGERILAMSEIRCVGPTVMINGTRYCSPFEIKAIGKSEDLEVALKMPGGFLDTWNDYLDISVTKSKNIKIEKFKGALKYKYAKRCDE